MENRNAAGRLRELAEELEQIAVDESGLGEPGDRLETVAVLGLAWIAVAVAEALGR